MECNCNHKPTEQGWVQTCLNVNLSAEKSETATVITERSKNPNKDADTYTILDPEDASGTILNTVDQFISINDSVKYCYHPGIENRIFRWKNKKENGQS